MTTTITLPPISRPPLDPVTEAEIRALLRGGDLPRSTQQPGRAPTAGWGRRRDRARPCIFLGAAWNSTGSACFAMAQIVAPPNGEGRFRFEFEWVSGGMASRCLRVEPHDPWTWEGAFDLLTILERLRAERDRARVPAMPWLL